MEYMEIILKDTPMPFLKTILSEPLIFHPADILSSRLFSSAAGRACQYARSGTGTPSFGERAPATCSSQNST